MKEFRFSLPDDQAQELHNVARKHAVRPVEIVRARYLQGQRTLNALASPEADFYPLPLPVNSLVEPLTQRLSEMEARLEQLEAERRKSAVTSTDRPMLIAESNGKSTVAQDNPTPLALAVAKPLEATVQAGSTRKLLFDDLQERLAAAQNSPLVVFQ